MQVIYATQAVVSQMKVLCRFLFFLISLSTPTSASWRLSLYKLNTSVAVVIISTDTSGHHLEKNLNMVHDKLLPQFHESSKMVFVLYVHASWPKQSWNVEQKINLNPF